MMDTRREESLVTTLRTSMILFIKQSSTTPMQSQRKQMKHNALMKLLGGIQDTEKPGLVSLVDYTEANFMANCSLIKPGNGQQMAPMNSSILLIN